MGLFGKKKEEKNAVPTLPELPKLPDFPSPEGDHNIPQLPSFPRNPFGDEFSKSTIKGAVAGGDHGSLDLDDMPEESHFVEDGGFEGMQEHNELRRKGPIFVRVDKVEASLKHLDDLKNKIGEIDKTLRKLRDVKVQEDKELKSWEEELKLTKQKVEKIDNNLFSRIN